MAMDIDQRMVGEVKTRSQTLGYSNLDVRFGDALKADLGTFHVCAANLPYQISSPFVFRLIAHRPKFRCAVLMFQREFAERLLARAGDKCYCRLSLNVQLYCDVVRVCKVSAGSFSPPPKVESMIVKMTPKQTPVDVNFREWDGLLRVCFCRKNKTLRSSFNNTQVFNTLTGLYRGTFGGDEDAKKEHVKNLVLDILLKAEMSGERSSSIALNGFLTLLLAMNSRGIYFSKNDGQDTDVPMLMEDDDMMDED
eukprot:GHVO01034761.1.p1 GENE.GHVO01034761.1~~GHVO01034761.1.p1  ORF type:complete len:280 (+),score=74.12 GHVO01034761.1:86-841(+)